MMKTIVFSACVNKFCHNILQYFWLIESVKPSVLKAVRVHYTISRHRCLCIHRALEKSTVFEMCVRVRVLANVDEERKEKVDTKAGKGVFGFIYDAFMWFHDA